MARSKASRGVQACFDFQEEFDDRLVYPGKRIAGVDEAGRGPLAGPVVAAAVVLPPDIPLEQFGGLTDSKALSAHRREIIFERIQALASAIGTGIVEAPRIDQINILQATLEAMQMAVIKLDTQVDLVLVDGLQTPKLDIPAKAIVKGDLRSASIAAASIIAKVTRDRIMIQAHEEYPQYRFDRHKGYGSRFHLAALQLFGPSPFHRQSFSPVAESNAFKLPSFRFFELYRDIVCLDETEFPQLETELRKFESSEKSSPHEIEYLRGTFKFRREGNTV